MPELDVNVQVETGKAQKSFRKQNPKQVQNVNQQNKKKNKNRKQKNRSQRAPKRRYALTSAYSFSDLSLEKGVHEASSSFFFPGNGIFRGQAKAFEMSGLATLKGTVIVSNSTSADNIFAFTFCPAAASQAGWLTYGFGSSIVGALNTATAAIISTTQAEAFRCVAGQLSLTPQGSFTNQAGSGLTGYVSDLTNFTGTATNIANLVINRPFKAVDTQMLHWLPSENSIVDETEFQSVGTSFGGPSTSAIIGYIQIPTSNDTSTSWQLDYLVGLEYLPSPAYRPFIDKAPPCQDIRSLAYVNQLAMNAWNPLMIGTIQEYERELLKHDAIEGARTQAHDVAHYAVQDRDNIRKGLLNVYDTAGANNSDFVDRIYNAGVSAFSAAGNKILRDIVDPVGVINNLIPGTAFDIPMPAIMG